MRLDLTVHGYNAPMGCLFVARLSVIDCAFLDPRRGLAGCDLLDRDSTIERIAEHLEADVHSRCPDRPVPMCVCEGVMKGVVMRTLSSDSVSRG